MMMVLAVNRHNTYLENWVSFQQCYSLSEGLSIKSRAAIFYLSTIKSHAVVLRLICWCGLCNMPVRASLH